MHPSITEQLDGMRHVLATVIAPHVADPYATDVLNGIVSTIATLGRWTEVPAFMRDDAAQTAELLATIGVTSPEPPVDLLDIAALTEHHRAVRGLLERSMPSLLADPDARSAVVLLFRDRCARFPLTNRRAGQPPTLPPTPHEPSGAPDAHSAR
jgi:hypothetical protein